MPIIYSNYVTSKLFGLVYVTGVRVPANWSITKTVTGSIDVTRRAPGSAAQRSKRRMSQLRRRKCRDAGRWDFGSGAARGRAE